MKSLLGGVMCLTTLAQAAPALKSDNATFLLLSIMTQGCGYAHVQSGILILPVVTLFSWSDACLIIATLYSE